MHWYSCRNWDHFSGKQCGFLILSPHPCLPKPAISLPSGNYLFSMSSFVSFCSFYISETKWYLSSSVRLNIMLLSSIHIVANSKFFCGWVTFYMYYIFTRSSIHGQLYWICHGLVISLLNIPFHALLDCTMSLLRNLINNLMGFPL